MRSKQGLIIEELADGGCLVVDEEAQQSHALQPAAAAVWKRLENGDSDIASIVAATDLDEKTVAAAIAQLGELGLIVEGGSSRRQLLSRAATVAGAAVSLKLIETIATPAPAAAQSMDVDGAPADDG